MLCLSNQPFSCQVKKSLDIFVMVYYKLFMQRRYAIK